MYFCSYTQDGMEQERGEARQGEILLGLCEYVDRCISFPMQLLLQAVALNLDGRMDG